jgi:flagellar protein FliL
MFKNKKVLIGGAVFFAAAFWFYIKPNYMDAKVPPVYTEAMIAAAPRPTLVLEERVLNLKAPASAPNYVKASIALEFEDPKHKYISLKGHAIVIADEKFTEEMHHNLPKIWDTITQVVGSKSVEDVSSTPGREALKEELIEALNHELHDEKVEKIFFVTFITQ